MLRRDGRGAPLVAGLGTERAGFSGGPTHGVESGAL